jgi:hypothetical protein
VDALSDVLAAIRLDGAVYIKAEFKAPWCVETQYGLHTAASRLPRSDHIVFFHLLTDGSCKARLVDGSEEFEVAAGDLLLFPHDHRHLLGTDLTLSPAPVGSDAIEGLIEMRWGGDGEGRDYPVAILPATAAPAARCRRCCAYHSATSRKADGSPIFFTSACRNRSPSGPAPSRCSQSFRSSLSSKRCAAMRNQSRPISRAGLPDCRILMSAARSLCCMAIRSAPGRSMSLRARWHCHVRRSPSALPR